MERLSGPILRETRNALALAHLLKVKALHYVSTAYVAGTVVGRVMEGALPATGFNNSYEKSKFEAEKLVRECGIPYTIYRPSIIVGRLSDGLIRKPLAFYRIMEFLGKFKKTLLRQEWTSAQRTGQDESPSGIQEFRQDLFCSDRLCSESDFHDFLQTGLKISAITLQARVPSPRKASERRLSRF